MIPLDNLNCEEKKAIEDLEMRIKGDLPPSLYKDPTVFYRFLKARDFDLDKAEKMLRKHITWRKAHQIDTIVEDFKSKEMFCKYVEPRLIGLDKNGEAVIYLPVGKLNTNDLLKGIKMSDGVRHFIWYLEKLKSFVRDLNKEEGRSFNLSQISLIFDLDKLTLSNTVSKNSVDALLRLVSVAQDNNPELLKSVYITNAPSYFVLAYSILKAIMSNAMIQKLHFFGRTGFQKDLLESIDEDVLPAFLGGNRTDPDGNPMCDTFLRHPDKLSPEYYLSNEDRYFKDKTQVEKIVVPASGKKKICVNVTEPESLINWRFCVKSKDIDFGLSFEESDQEVEELIPLERYITPDGTEEGFYKAKSIGKYVIIFDNTFSWLCSKEIEYSITVVKPE